MKMYGLGLTSQGYLLVRDHRSRGEPFIFWRHNWKAKTTVEEEWKVVAGWAVDGVGLVFKKLGSFLKLLILKFLSYNINPIL
jgi:hypothetical protein